MKIASRDILRAIRRPEYWFRPSQVWRRLRRDSLCSRNAVQLAWGLPIEVDPSAWVGLDIVNLGVHDRAVPEAIWRLLDRGEAAYDIGANIGQNASIMALKLGRRGRVSAFEPGPQALRLLARNVASWQGYDLAPITVVNQGVSRRAGVGTLHETADLGGFSMEAQCNRPYELSSSGDTIEVKLTTIDEFASSGEEIALIKIDVEGHEEAVLEGAARMLERKRVRDILCEDFHEQPSPIRTKLEAFGYRVFALYAGWHKPRLVPLERSKGVLSTVNFLATRDPERACARFKAAGWKCLMARARLKPIVTERSTAPHTRKP